MLHIICEREKEKMKEEEKKKGIIEIKGKKMKKK